MMASIIKELLRGSGLLALRLCVMPYNTTCAAVAGFATLPGNAERPRRLLRTPRRGMNTTTAAGSIVVRDVMGCYCQCRCRRCACRMPEQSDEVGGFFRLSVGMSFGAFLWLVMAVAIVADDSARSDYQAAWIFFGSVAATMGVGALVIFIWGLLDWRLREQ